MKPLSPARDQQALCDTQRWEFWLILLGVVAIGL